MAKHEVMDVIQCYSMFSFLLLGVAGLGLAQSQGIEAGLQHIWAYRRCG